jgi:drug/metabolite transporter (DMT)-like permease
MCKNESASHDDVIPGTDATTFAAFLALVLLAGGNAVAIRYSSCQTCELDPFWAAAARFLVTASIFAVIARVLHLSFPRGRALLVALTYGALQFGAGFGFIYWGFARAPAGLGQVLLACVPLLTFFLALAHRQERFRWSGLVGATLAVAGISVVFNSGLDAGVPLRSMVAILAGALCWAEAFIVVKAAPPLHVAVMNTIAMSAGAAILFVLTVVFGDTYSIPERASTWGALAYLVTAGSVGVFALYLVVLRRWTASQASYQLVLIPLVTIVVSAWLQDERVTWSFAAGSALVLVGVYFGVLRRPATRAG